MAHSSLARTAPQPSSCALGSSGPYTRHRLSCLIPSCPLPGGFRWNMMLLGRGSLGKGLMNAMQVVGIALAAFSVGPFIILIGLCRNVKWTHL